ncbi:MAG: hypothetical protein ABIP48_12830 [Planctomycetota bacterium]
MASSRFLNKNAGPPSGIVSGSILALLMALLSVDAQEVRPYPDPGYRRLGVYGGGPESHFDYHLVKLRLGDTFPDKKQFWSGLKARRAEQQDSHRHDLYFLYCGERTDGLEAVTARVDAWLKPEPDIPTYPELIPAVSINEENVGSRNAVLDGLARHIRKTYGIPVFQFYSMPLEPNPGLTADGWVFDAYGRQHVEFRKHLMKHVVLDKPVVCIPWASDPHWPGWSRSPDTEAMINREWHQFGTCMEFDVSCAVFAVAGPGAMNPWLGSQTRDMVKLRNWLRTKRAEMHAFEDGDLPLPSAGFSARDRGVGVGGDREAPSVYEEDFSAFSWIHDADVRGFLDLKLTSRPDEPGLLLTKTAPKRKVRTSLTYRFESYFPLESVRITLDAAAPAAARCRNELAISTDELGRSWPLAAEQTESDAIRPLTLGDDGQLRGQHVFYLRITMENDADQQDLPGNRLDRLTVECVHQPPSPPAAAKLTEDAYGNLTYEDDFSTSRWRHLGEMKVGHEDHGGYRDGGFWVGMVGGYATSTEVVERISSPQDVKELVVTADCYADGRNLGGRVVLKIGPRGEEPKWETGTEGLHRGPLRLDVPGGELDGLREFDVHLLLQSSSGVEHGEKACATVTGLIIEAK